MVDLPSSLTGIAYSGSSVVYTATEDVVLRFNLTGAGGAGGIDPLNRKADYAGGGGVTTGRIAVTAGDTITIEVGGAGTRATAVSLGGIGVGGWPDGGNGGYNAGDGYSGGGGGGSTRLYKNGTLVAVAGAGGGGAYLANGEGGGLVGKAGQSGGGGGGTQSAGGTGASGGNGSSLNGGDSPNAVATAGAGGGGGYYGGGGGSPTSSGYRGAGGGSGYLNTALMIGGTGTNTQAVSHAPVGSEGPGGVGVGGQTGWSATNVAMDGGNGYAVIEPMEPAVLPYGSTTVTYTGPSTGSKFYTVAEAGPLRFNLTGGGGGGGFDADGLDRRAGYAGGGGVTAGTIMVNPGDLVEIYVGGAGGRATARTTAGVGPGGWPDGGSGGIYALYGYTGGGGGGSTRLYVNGVLMAVAGAGGGGCYTGTGEGGGTTGRNGAASNGSTTGGGGGSQVAGGAGPGGGLASGGSLRGGNSPLTNFAGGGGGGGYYGGGAGTGATVDTYGGGGGGSGYINSTYVTGGTNVQAVSHLPVGSLAAAGTGAGGQTGFLALNAAMIGGNGAAVLLFDKPLDPSVPEEIEYTGASTTYRITQAGLINIKGWGGAGAGGTYGADVGRPGRSGGAGGAFTAQIYVKPDDLIKVEVGGGGKKASGPNAAPTAGGNGGWPDGGYGGRSSYNDDIMFGGGGGSTRIYKNDVLVAVAGGGGGSTGYYSGGNGGGEIGAGAETGGGAAGGTQTTAGALGGAFLGGRPASQTTLGSGGAGGGGGWFGGGTDNNTAGSHGAGGGGSGRLGDNVTGQILRNVTQAVPPADAVLPSGRAAGGASANNISGVADGGDGFVYIEQTAVTTTDYLATDDYDIEFTGAPQRYVAESEGLASLKLWGGGGSGGTYGLVTTRTDRLGGAGGYVTADVPVSPGDVLEFWIGEGGRKGVLHASGLIGIGGRGGFPDGGPGGVASANASIRYGGGGGSTRVYKNGVLILVAPAGGGSTGYYHGGWGGGTTGGKGDSAGEPNNGAGGTQVAGGVLYGASLKGANGSGTVSGRSDVATSTSGAGGGGGYYGGGTTNGGANLHGSGGGGSSYIAGGLTGSTQSGGTNNGVPYSQPELPSGRAAGGAVTTSLSTVGEGGHGFAYMSFIATEEGHPDSEPFPNSIVLTPPEADMNVPGDAFAEPFENDVELLMLLAAGPTAGAIILAPVSDDDIYLEIDEEGAASATGAVSVTRALPGPIVLTAPRGSIEGYGQSEPFENDLTLVAPDAIAEPGSEAISEAFENAITFPATIEATVTGAANAYPIPLGDAPPYYFAGLNFTPPEADVETIGSAVGEPLPNDITLAAIDGTAEEGVEAFAEFDSEVVFSTTLAATATGAASAVSQINGPSDNPPDRYMVRIVYSAPNADVTGEVYLAVDMTLDEITFQAPAGVTEFGVNIAASISPPNVRLRPPSAYAGEAAGALAIADLDDFEITIEPVYGYVDLFYPATTIPIRGFNAVRLKRSLVSGAGTTLAEREVAINEADGVLYTRDGNGVVIPTPLYDIQSGAELPTAGDPGQILRGDASWGSPSRVYNAPVRFTPRAGERVFLSEGAVGLTTAAITPATAYYRPFFVPKPILLSDIGLEITAGAVGTVHVAIVMWNLDRTPGALLWEDQFDGSGTGLQTIYGELYLVPGWYAAAVAVVGLSPTFQVQSAPTILSSTFTAQGDATAAFPGDFSPPPNPSGFAASAPAILSASV